MQMQIDIKLDNWIGTANVNDSVYTNKRII